MLATPSYLVTDLMKNLEELTAERRILTEMEDSLELLFVDEQNRRSGNRWWRRLSWNHLS
jgi:hypothetical protein